jgi:hypothetical protein
MKFILILVSVVFCSSVSFRMFNSNTVICTHLKSWSVVNQRKTIAAFAADAGGTGSKNVFLNSNPSQLHLSGCSPLTKVFHSNTDHQEIPAVPFKLRSFVMALHRARSRTVSKAERSAIMSTMVGIVNDMTEIDLSRSVCR